MHASLTQVEVVVLLGLIGLAVMLLTLVVERQLDAWRRRRRAQGAARGEQRARRLLERAGFVIEREQAVTPWLITVGDEVLSIALRADYLVRRGNERFVAEVKTGGLVSNVTYGPTRRQLLEYQLAFETDGVLLVDAHMAEVREVSFPGLYR